MLIMLLKLPRTEKYSIGSEMKTNILYNTIIVLYVAK